MHILVTGGKGQLGRSLRDLADQYPITARFVDIEELDLTDIAACREFFAANPCDVVINCAAFTAVDLAEDEVSKARLVNTGIPSMLGEFSNEFGFKVIHISTDYVFDGKGNSPYKETDQPNPQSVYGLTKLEGEWCLLRSNPDAVIVRTAWLYSPYGKNFFLTMRGKALSGESVKVVSDQIGTPTLASDLAKALLEITISDTWRPGIYHFTNEGSASWFDFTRAIYELSGADPSLVSPIATADYPTKARRPLYSILDKTKIKNTYKLNIRPWEDALASLQNYGT